MTRESTRSLKILPLMFLLMSLSVASCGGGGGGGGGGDNSDVQPGSNNTSPPGEPTTPPIKKSKLELSWQAPSKRQNGSPLPKEEIKGYIVIMISSAELEQLLQHPYVDAQYPELDIDTFLKDSEFNRYITPSIIEALIGSGNEHVTFLDSPEQNSISYEELAAGEYFMAISTVDTDYVFSNLSHTVSRRIAD